MTYDEAKEELSMCRYLKHDIATCKEEIDRLRQELIFTSSIIKIPDVQNPLISTADEIRYRLDEQMQRYCRILSCLQKTESLIHERIATVSRENKLSGVILQLRFINGHRLPEIARELRYSYQRIRNVSYQAVRLYAIKNDVQLQVGTQCDMSIG